MKPVSNIRLLICDYMMKNITNRLSYFVGTKLLCCREQLCMLGFVQRIAADASILETMKTLIFFGENERFYAYNAEKESLCLLGESIAIVNEIGLHRYEEIYSNEEIPYLVELDDVMRALLRAQFNLFEFSRIIAANSGKTYFMTMDREPMDNMLTLFLVQREEFSIQEEWDLLQNIYDRLPFYGHIIGSVGKGYLYPKSVFLVMDINGAIFGIDTLSYALAPCMKIVDSFDSLLKQGILPMYRRYKFVKDQLYLPLYLIPTCPHRSNNLNDLDLT